MTLGDNVPTLFPLNDLFAKNDKLSIFLFGQSGEDFGDLQRSESFVVFPANFYMNAAVCSHSQSGTNGLLCEQEVEEKPSKKMSETNLFFMLYLRPF